MHKIQWCLLPNLVVVIHQTIYNGCCIAGLVLGTGWTCGCGDTKSFLGAVKRRVKSNIAGLDTLQNLTVNVHPDIISSTRTSFLEELVPVPAMSVRDLMCAQHHEWSLSKRLADGWWHPVRYGYRTNKSIRALIKLSNFYHEILKVRSIEESIQ